MKKFCYWGYLKMSVGWSRVGKRRKGDIAYSTSKTPCLGNYKDFCTKIFMAALQITQKCGNDLNT